MSELTAIGGLRDALSTLNPNLPVYVGNRPPTALSSYRGYYDHLAIERGGTGYEATVLEGRGDPFELNMAGYGTYSPGHGRVRIASDATVADLTFALDLAIGETFEGYKGGQFVMRAGTDLWVSEYGDVDQLRVVAVEDLPDRVDLVLEGEEW